MTTITHTRQGTRHTLTAVGHAGYAPAGQDVVCAAVSTLLCTLNACLQEAYDRAQIEHFSAEMGSGDTRLCWEDTGEDGGAWDTIRCGLRLLSGHYQAYVQYKEESV
mgnify:CR=1 FL=1